VALELEPFGDAALRVRLPPGSHAPSLLGALRRVPGVVDAIVAEQHAVVTFDPGRAPDGIAEAFEAGLASRPADGAGAEHRIAVRYTGEDLDEVAARAGLSTREVAALHAGGRYTVVAVGFLPGFAYLRGLDARLIGPRRSSPRSRVAALSVAVAGPYAGVYPFASPGGWNVIGQAVGFTPFDALTGAKLALGDTVRFVQVEP
jgi:UPF0271 protein